MDYAPMGAWLGLSAAHNMPELCRSAILGVLSALRQSCELLFSLDRPRGRLVLQALAAREKSVRDSACALFPGEKWISYTGEASLLGAAMLGMRGVGAFSSLGEAVAAAWHGKRCDEAAGVSGTEAYYGRYVAFAARLDAFMQTR